MKQFSLRLLDLSVLTVLLCTACDDSDDHMTANDPTVLSGRFLDSAVTGLAYTTATQQGFTDKEGRYQYRKGESVNFYIGDPQLPDDHAWSLGETAGNDIVTPLELLHTDTINQPVRNTLRLLQTLDIDREPANGIELPSATITTPDGKLWLDLTQTDAEFQNDPVILDYIKRVNASTELVPAQTAIDHFQLTLNELLEFPTGKWIYSHGTIDGLAISDLSASIEWISETEYTAWYQRMDDNGAVSASFVLDGISFGARVNDYHLTMGDRSVLPLTNNLDLTDELSALPGSIHDFIDVALALDAKLKIQPNTLSLESIDGSIVLHYTRSDSTGNETIAYLQIYPENAVFIEADEHVQLHAIARTASSAMVFPMIFTWTSSDPSIATVDNEGRITAISSGFVTIEVSAAGFQTAIQLEVGLSPSQENEPDPHCPDGYVPTQINEESVIQVNIPGNDVESVEQSNQQDIAQNNTDTHATCTLWQDIPSAIPNSGL